MRIYHLSVPRGILMTIMEKRDATCEEADRRLVAYAASYQKPISYLNPDPANAPLRHGRCAGSSARIQTPCRHRGGGTGAGEKITPVSRSSRPDGMEKVSRSGRGLRQVVGRDADHRGRQRRRKSLTNTSTGSPTSKKMKAARDDAIYMHPFPRPRCGSNQRGDG